MCLNRQFWIAALPFVLCVSFLSLSFAAQAGGNAPPFCDSPSPSQEHTLLALASTVGETYSAGDCERLYQHLHQQQTLNLEEKHIDDLTPLGGLVRLEKLFLDNNKIHDVTPLAGLKGLQKLFLVNNRITDIEPLGSLHRLTYLYLTGNRVKDLSPLRNLKELQYLFLSYNSVESLHPLRHSYKLTWLIADNNLIDSVSSLRRLKYIKRIDLRHNPLINAAAIAHFPNFKKFHFPEGISFQPLDTGEESREKTPTVVASPGAKTSTVDRHPPQPSMSAERSAERLPPEKADTSMPSKTIPEVSEGDDEEVSPQTEMLVAKMVAVEPPTEKVEMPGYYVGRSYPLLCKRPTASQKKTLTILAEKAGMAYSPDNCLELYKRLNRLIMLIIQEKGLEDLTPLESLTNLTWLFLYNNRIHDIYPLQNMTKLRSLGLNHNRIEDITPLEALKNLTTLSLHNNRIKDISPLKNLTRLTSVSLHHNRISDISPLRGLTDLSSLKLSYNDIDDIGPLGNLEQLNELHLKQNRITEISSLKNLSQLNQLDLRSNHIDDFTPIQHLDSFPRFILKEKHHSN